MNPSILPPFDVDPRADDAVRAPASTGSCRGYGRSTDPWSGSGTHDVSALCFHRDPVGSGERAEVVIERAVLLHDHDDVA